MLKNSFTLGNNAMDLNGVFKNLTVVKSTPFVGGHLKKTVRDTLWKTVGFCFAVCDVLGLYKMDFLLSCLSA